MSPQLRLAHLDVSADELLRRGSRPVDAHLIRCAGCTLGGGRQQCKPVAAGVVLPQPLLQGVEHRLQLNTKQQQVICMVSKAGVAVLSKGGE